MAAQDHGGADLLADEAETAIDEGANLVADDLVAAECIGQGVEDDEAGLEFFTDIHQVTEPVCQDGIALPLVEVHEDIVLTDA